MLIKFTDCRLAVNGVLIEKDLWIDSTKGIIVDPQKVFYDDLAMPDRIIRLGGKIISPGFIDIQINGAMGMDFSVFRDDETYSKGVKLVNKTLIKYGVTAYCPTLTSQPLDIYKQVLLFHELTNSDTPSSSTFAYPELTGWIRNPWRPCRRSLPPPKQARSPRTFCLPHCLYWRVQRH
jgi:hypothetical protein